MLSACERFGMPPELFTLRIDRDGHGRARLVRRERAQQIELLAYEQIRVAEEAEKTKAMLEASIGRSLV